MRRLSLAAMRASQWTQHLIHVRVDSSLQGRMGEPSCNTRRLFVSGCSYSNFGATEMGSVDSRLLGATGGRSVGAMRVVICEPDADIRDALQQSLDERSEFKLVGMSRTWSDCAPILEGCLPELFIYRAGIVHHFSSGDSIFPVCVQSCWVGTPSKDRLAFATIDLPLREESLANTLDRACGEIYRRKLEDLWYLMQSYLNHGGGPGLPSVAGCDGYSLSSRISADRVVFIAADRNYVRVHGDGGVQELRDTMSAMTARLDPALFARVHRSFIVNRRFVRDVVRKEGTVVSVRLNDGTELPVGPNYRAAADRLDLPASA